MVGFNLLFRWRAQQGGPFSSSSCSPHKSSRLCSANLHCINRKMWGRGSHALGIPAQAYQQQPPTTLPQQPRWGIAVVFRAELTTARATRRALVFFTHPHMTHPPHHVTLRSLTQRICTPRRALGRPIASCTSSVAMTQTPTAATTSGAPVRAPRTAGRLQTIVSNVCMAPYPDAVCGAAGCPRCIARQ